MSVHGNIVTMKMAALDLSMSQLAAYTGINLNKLSPWLAGTRDIDNPTVERINTTIRDLERLMQIANPWPLDLRKVSDIKALLVSMRAGEFDCLAESVAHTV